VTVHRGKTVLKEQMVLTISSNFLSCTQTYQGQCDSGAALEDRLAESPAAAKFEAAMASVGDLVVRF
jgi:hypothetical protein